MINLYANEIDTLPIGIIEYQKRGEINLTFNPLRLDALSTEMIQSLDLKRVEVDRELSVDIRFDRSTKPHHQDSYTQWERLSIWLFRIFLIIWILRHLT